MNLKIIGIGEKMDVINFEGYNTYETENFPLLESIYYKLYNKRITGWREGFEKPVRVRIEDEKINEMIRYARSLKFKNIKNEEEN
jgi:hypothetical protein